MFEATRSGFDGQLALDDVAFVAGPCSLPTMCSFESQTCGYTSSGRARWIHQSWSSTETGPKTDHSLETENGLGNLSSVLIKHFFIQCFCVSFANCNVFVLFTHPQAIEDVDEFVTSSEQIWKNLALHHLLTNGSSAVNGCHQNASPTSWYKHHNNPHHSSLPVS